MSVLGSVFFNAALLGILAVVAAGLTFRLTHGALRGARGRSVLLRQRERERREYWGYE